MDESTIEILDALQEVIEQACTDSDGKLDSMALTSYAYGMRVLEKHGRIKIESEFGRRVIGTITQSLEPF